MVFAIGDEQWPGISKLTEECGELVQVMGKLMAIAGQTDHWSGDLRKMLIEEMGDVAAALIFVRDHCLTKREVKKLAKRADEKAKRFEEWHIRHTPQKRVLKQSSKARRKSSNASTHTKRPKNAPKTSQKRDMGASGTSINAQ